MERRARIVDVKCTTGGVKVIASGLGVTYVKAQRTANWILAISVAIGITQILLILYQIFGQ